MTKTCNEPDYDAVEAAYAEQMAGYSPLSMTPQEYRGLYGEVAGTDCYGFRDLTFVPDVILDVGANVGIFSRFARELFPLAHIVAVEPDQVNCDNFIRLTPLLDNVMLLRKAIGSGQMWKSRTHRNGAMVTYLCETLGFGREGLLDEERFELSDVEAVSFASLCAEYVPAGKRCAAKIDCEGAENALIQDADSLAALSRLEYFAIEMHYYGDDADQGRVVRAVTEEALRRLSETHVLVLNHQTQVLQATRKE